MRPGVWTPPRGSQMPQWPFTINYDHPYSQNLEFAWVFVPGLGGVDLAGFNKVSSIVNATPSISFDGSIATGGVVGRFTGSASSDRVDLGPISADNPLQLRGLPFALSFGALFDVSLIQMRLIDKSDGPNSSNGWSIYYRQSEFVRLSTLGGTWSWDQSAHGIFRPAVAYLTINGFGVTTADLWVDGDNKGQINETVETISFTSAVTNASIGNWNHDVDRQWNGEIFYIDIHQGRNLSDPEAHDRWNPATRWDVYYPLGRTRIFLGPPGGLELPGISSGSNLGSSLMDGLIR